MDNFNYDFLNDFDEKSIVTYFNEPMRHHTSFKIGGNADVYCLVKNSAALTRLLKICRKREIPYYIIGKGSNLLVSDSGIRGAVIRLGGDFKNISLVEDGLIRCGAGASLASLCGFALNHSLGGMEFAWGIPGSVGGATFMNAGAYGGEIKDVVISAIYIDENGDRKRYEGSELDFGYRKSAFSGKSQIITDVFFKLEHKAQKEIREKMDELMGRRKSKQPLDYPSAGSTFKRPDGYYAAALIEECGLKGESVGGAQVSEKHAGFIINKGGATCEDVKSLIENIKKQVYNQKGVRLQCEVKFIGA